MDPKDKQGKKPFSVGDVATGDAQTPTASQFGAGPSPVGGTADEGITPVAEETATEPLVSAPPPPPAPSPTGDVSSMPEPTFGSQKTEEPSLGGVSPAKSTAEPEEESTTSEEAPSMAQPDSPKTGVTGDMTTPTTPTEKEEQTDDSTGGSGNLGLK